MTHLLSRAWMIVMFVLCTLPAISACQSGEAGSTPAVTAAAGTPVIIPAASTAVVTPAASAPATTPTIGSQATPAGSPTRVGVVLGSGPFVLPETTAGLSDLSSYKATLTLAFDGTKAGKTQQWSKTYVMLSAQKPAVRQLTIMRAGDLSDLGRVLMAERDGTTYEQRGTNVCTASAIESGNSLGERMEPAGFLSGVIGADVAGNETVNGTAANHYTFDQRAFGQLGLTKSTGEMWVASNGGYIVRYKVATQGAAAYFGEGIKGTLTWDYELTGANQPVAMELPKECPAGMVNAPLLADATGVHKAPGLLSYRTPSSLAAAAAFYQKQIPLLDWTPLGKPITTDTFELLDYTQGANTMTVVITAVPGGTTVQIVVGTGQP